MPNTKAKGDAFEHLTYSKSKRPLNIPSNPQRIYIKEWKGWADFLGKED